MFFLCICRYSLESNVLIDETPSISPTEVRAKCRRLKRQHPDLAMVVVDYLQLNVNFVTYTYKSMYGGLLKIDKDTQLSFSETEESIQNEVLDNLKKNCCCHDKNSLFLSFSHEKLINNNFLDTKIIEDNLVEEQKEKVETKLKYRDKSLAYMNSELERKVKILKVRNDNLSKQLIKMKKNENKFLKFNF